MNLTFVLKLQDGTVFRLEPGKGATSSPGTHIRNTITRFDAGMLLDHEFKLLVREAAFNVARNPAHELL